MAMAEAAVTICILPHGIELNITDTANLKISQVADFLADAMKHFKRHRDEMKTELYKDGPYAAMIERGPKALGRCQISNPGDPQGNLLTANQWTEAVIHAYSTSNTIEQMQQSIDAFYAQAKPGDSVHEILELIGQRGGDLRALALMVKRPGILG
jgi:hypothetical protein